MKHYDVIVVGSGVGGLSAANYHAVAGQSVLVLEQRDELGGKAAAQVFGGVTTDPGPSILIMKWVYEQAFTDWGESFSEHCQLLPLPGLIDLCYDGTIWHLPSGESEFLGYIKENFEDDYEGFTWLSKVGSRIYDKLQSTVYARTYSSLVDLFSLPIDLHPDSLSLLKPFGALVESKFTHPAIKGLLYDYLTYSGHCASQPSPVSWLILYTMIKEGCFYPQGGIHTIPEALVRVARSRGVELKTNQKVSSITPYGSSQYRIDTNATSYLCSKLIMNVDPLITLNLLKQNNQSPHQSKPSQSSKPSYSYCTLTYSYSQPCTAAHHTLVIPPDYVQSYSDLFNHQPPNPEQLVYYLNHPSITDSQTDQYLFVVAPVSTTALHSDPSPTSAWEQLTHNFDLQVRRDLKRYFDCCDLTLIAVQTPQTFESRDSNPDGSLFGSGYSWLNLLPQPNRIKNHPNIIHVGGAVQPGAGLPMVLLSGKFSSQD